MIVRMSEHRCPVGFGAGDIGRRASPDPHTPGAAAWSTPEGEAGSPRIRNNATELTETQRTLGRSRLAAAGDCAACFLPHGLRSPNFPTSRFSSKFRDVGLFFDLIFMFQTPLPLEGKP